MMEMIRSWRTLSFGGFGHAALARIRAWRILHFTKWAIAILLIGSLTGAMTVIFPPMASIGVVALAGVLLLWAMPDLHFVPDKLLRKMFFIMVFVQLCVPAYYAIDTGLLPWISVRRFFIAAAIFLFCITVAGSKVAREKISDAVKHNHLLAFLSFGFLAMLFISVFTAKYRVVALNGVVDAILTWYVPLFACILIVRTEKDVILLLKVIAVAGILDSFLGAVEFFLQRKYYFDIFPKSMLQAMLASNPALDIIYNTVWFRNGIYRASSIYTVPLSFGEIAAIVAPVGAYFLFHGENMRWRTLGCATVLASIIALLVSGARGGFIAFLVAMPIMTFLWTVRYSRMNRGSLVGTIMAGVFLVGTIATITLVVAWPRASNIVLGGGDTANSTDARRIQWNMAVPHILSNPVTGHGKSSAADVVGFYNPGNPIPTIDSYVITLLVEQGIPGFVLFFGMIAFGIWTGVKLYVGNTNERAAIGGPIAGCLIAFAVYRLALSQTENHTLFFLIVGLVFAVARLSRDWPTEAKHLYPYGHSDAWLRPVSHGGGVTNRAPR